MPVSVYVPWTGMAPLLHSLALETTKPYTQDPKNLRLTAQSREGCPEPGLRPLLND